MSVHLELSPGLILCQKGECYLTMAYICDSAAVVFFFQWFQKSIKFVAALQFL